MNEQSIYHLFREVCEQNREKVAYRFKRNGEWQDITWAEQQAQCTRIAKSLLALGIEKPDKITILSQTRLEWVQCDMAIVSIGAVTVGIYPTLLGEECAYIINHSDAVLLFVENQAQLDKILAVRGQTSKLRHIVLLDGAAPDQSGSGVLSWEDFLALGQERSDAEFAQRTETLSQTDIASIVYTSGTTGVPKGAMITHGNLLFAPWSASESLYLETNFETLLFLPLAHVFARLIVYFCIRKSIIVAFAESIEKVSENLREIRPHFIASVPRIFEKAYEKITQGVEDAGGLKAKLFNWALGLGYQVSKLRQQKQPIPGGLQFKHILANKLVFAKIQHAFGGRLVWAVSGAAPLNKAIAEFFHACGILILEGIGMTENTSFTNVNRYDHNKFGTVGPPGPLIEQKIAPDGEVLFRGKNVMAGYYKNPEATAETIDKDGWLYTGDIGEIDEDNFLRITDRKKDLIITAGGKNIAPQRVERILRTSRYFSQVVVFGDRKKYLTALVTLDTQQVQAWATVQGIAVDTWDELARHPQVKELVEREIAEKNRELASFETVKKISILPQDFSIDSGELTPTLKVKRKLVAERYRDLIESMYEES